MRVLVSDEKCERCKGEGRETIEIDRLDSGVAFDVICDCVRAVEIEAIYPNAIHMSDDEFIDEHLPIVEKEKP